MVQRTKLYPSIEDIVFRVAVQYENLHRSGKLDAASASTAKREWIMSKTPVSYLKKNPGEVVIYLAVAPYIFKRNGDHYFFDCVPIGREFHLNGSQISFSGKPKIYKIEHYNHPFVLDGNEICDSNDDRWSNPPLNIQWGLGYDINQRETIRKIANWLKEGRKLLQNGYFGVVSPRHSLNRENFSSEYISVDEAVRKGVRIIELM
ncbi:MAG: hypothetical protein KKC75_08380 [Nanoarchaeota archaeon]|nr:hypothetical protein [Nanoarchaeota archaeon]MBU1004488.1 hypothetical protein [Nanoarchaeota archaeon]MBU1945658.1 hypothetical protein [Nanoarchaeota archaeon]